MSCLRFFLLPFVRFYSACNPVTVQPYNLSKSVWRVYFINDKKKKIYYTVVRLCFENRVFRNYL